MLMLAFAACSRGSKPALIDESAIYVRTAVSSHDSLRSTAFSESGIIVRAWMIGATPKLVVVSDSKEPFLHVFDAVTGRHIRSLGIRGDGPGEFSGAPSLMRASLYTDTLWLLDGPRRRISGVPLAQLEHDSVPTTFSMFNFGSGLLYAADGPLRTGPILGLAENRMQGTVPMLSAARHVAPTAGAVQEMHDSRIDPSYWSVAYTGRPCASPHHNVFAQIFRYAGRIDLLDAAGHQLQSVDVPYPYPPYADVNHRVDGEIAFSSINDRVRDAYSDCAATERYLYALYNGRRRVADSLYPEPNGEIHVFGWNGKLVRTLVLDHRTYGIAVPPGDSVIFTFTEDSLGTSLRRMVIRP